jgi:hypothetical protein
MEQIKGLMFSSIALKQDYRKNMDRGTNKNKIFNITMV